MDVSSEDNLLNIQNSILDTFNFWLPFVEVRNIELLTTNDDTTIHSNEIRVKILFNIKQDPNTKDSVTLDFSSDISEPESSIAGGGY